MWVIRGGGVATNWETAVKSEVGELGYEVIRMYGWRNLCDLYFQGNLSAFNAQIRSFIQSAQAILKSKNVQSIYALDGKVGTQKVGGELVKGGDLAINFLERWGKNE